MTRRVVVAILIVLIAVIFGRVYLGFSRFSLKRAEIVGALEQEQLAKVTDKLKLYTGRNLVNLDISRVARDLRESFPWIYNLSVSKRFPDSLKVEVSTWKPVAIVEMGNDYLIDDSGKRIAPCPESNCPVLPRIKGVGDSYSQSSAQGERISFALDMINRIKNARAEPVLVEFVGDTSIKIDLSCGSTLEFLLKNALDSLDWLVTNWGAGEQGLCKYNWVLVMRRGKVVIKRGA